MNKNNCFIDTLSKPNFILILKYLNLKDWIVLIFTNKKLKYFIEDNRELFKILNFEKIPFKLNIGFIIKFINISSVMLEDIHIPDYLNINENNNIIINLSSKVKKIKLNNLEIDFRNIYNKKKLGKELISFKIKSLNLIKKKIDIKDIGFLEICLKNIKILHLENLILSDEIIYNFLKNTENIEEVSFINSINYTNNIFKILKKFCINIKHLYVGGNELNFNNNLSYEGVLIIKNYLLNITKLKFYYCGRIGDDCLKEISYIKNLQELTIIRNCLENSAKISNKGLKYLSNCNNLKKLSINYNRKFKNGINNILSNFRNLEILNLRECVIQDKLDNLSINCNKLKIIDLSGDSWIKFEVIDSLKNINSLEILKIGHIEHGNNTCKSITNKTLYINFFENLFSNFDNFKNLKHLYLEQNCSVSYWAEFIIKKVRFQIKIIMQKPNKDYSIFLKESLKINKIFKINII